MFHCILGDRVVLQSVVAQQTALPGGDPTIQVLETTPTPGGQIYTTPTVLNYNPVPPSAAPQPQDWYKEQQKVAGHATYIQSKLPAGRT